MTEERLVLLIARRLSGELTTEELAELDAWAKTDQTNRLFLDWVRDEFRIEKEIDVWKRIDPADGYGKWLASHQIRRRYRIIRMVVSSAAAAVLIVFGARTFIRSDRPAGEATAVKSNSAVQITPGRSTAILTLADGKHLLLDSTKEGNFLTQGNIRLLKTNNGHLSYEVAEKGQASALAYNELATPKSGQYQLTLPDGSEVWLNNVSSLRYPTSFQDKERIVELSGEAYFEIAKNPAQPFVVKVRDARIEVLGTSFDVAAYLEEGGTQTTLLTGSVQVGAGNKRVKLKPNEQAQVKIGDQINVLKNVPAEDIISWKNGFFYFGRTSFETMIRQLARWYDVEVVYEGKAPKMEFEGKIDRALPLSEVLKFLDKNQIHFRVEGRKLIVLPS